MKRAVAIALLAGAGWVGYEWLNDVMAREALGSAIEAAIDDPRTRTPEQMRAEIQQAARQQGISLAPSQIELELAAANGQPLAAGLITGAGLLTTTQRVTARVRYERRVWGQLRPMLIERVKLYVAAAAAPPGPQEQLLQRLP